MIYKCAVFFTCAVLLLLTVETGGTEKLCRLRERLYAREIWNYFSGFYCYNFTDGSRLKFKYPNPTAGLYENYSIPIQQINSTTYFTYNHKDEKSFTYIRRSFNTGYFFQLWKSCGEAAAECCDNIMNNENVYPTEEYPCPATWDAWSCFKPAKKGTIVEMLCSKELYSTESDVCELLSRKECFADGTWNQTTDYKGCPVGPVLRNRHTFNLIVLAVATVLSFPAAVIFLSMRAFRKNVRYILHRNLILIIVIRNMLTIMSKEIIILDALKTKDSNKVMTDNSVACRVLAFFENAAKNGIYACMLADGFYLHKLIVRAFANEPSLVHIYIVVLVLSFLPSVIWGIVRGVHEGTSCWMVDEVGDQWIIDGFRIAILAINFVLLLDIIRVMVMKLKRGSISQQARSTLRATLFLIPLFGLHIVFITNRNMVPSKTCQAEDIYYYITYLIEGLQGVMVAFLFCYINSEVRGELKNAFRKFALYLEIRFGVSFHKKQNNRRRTTAATFVDPFESNS